MRTPAGKRRRGSGFATVLSLPLALLFGVTACGDGVNLAREDDDDDRGREELAEFIDVAEGADCARDVNRIYRIDDAWVLWHREDLGCADAAYAITLYGATPDAELCSSHQTIAGDVTECRDSRARAEFETIVSNLDASDLGLGDAHTVELVWDGG